MPESPRSHPAMVPLLVSLTLGLAPFSPQPHIVEKLRMVFGGQLGTMAALDWFDLVMHGAPWVWLVAVLLTPRTAEPDAA